MRNNQDNPPAGLTSIQIAKCPTESYIRWQNSLRVYDRSDLSHTRIKKILIEYRTGLWIRTFSGGVLDIELETLEKREGKPSSDSSANVSRDSNYTKFSPSTFIAKGLPIMIFQPDDSCGVILKKRQHVIRYWDASDKKGFRSTEPEVFDFDATSLTNGEGTNHSNIRERKILTLLKTINKKYQNDSERQSLGDFDKMLQTNEGLFRYKTSDILAIYFNPSSARSAHHAIEFYRQLIERFSCRVPFFHYSPWKGLIFYKKHIVNKISEAYVSKDDESEDSILGLINPKYF